MTQNQTALLMQNVTPLGITPGAESFWFQELLQNAQKAPLCVHVVPSLKEGEALQAFLRFVCPQLNVVLWPSFEERLFSALPIENDFLQERTAVLHLLKALKEEPEEGVLLLLTPMGLCEKLPCGFLKPTSDRVLRLGDDCYQTALSHLQALGLHRADVVHQKGTYALRGGLLDVWPSVAEKPYRLDFMGDELQKIWLFDPLTQRKTDSVDALTLAPMHTYVLPEGSVSEKVSQALQQRLTHDAAQDALPSEVPLLWPLLGDETTSLVSWLQPDHVSLAAEVPAKLQKLEGVIQKGFAARLEADDLKEGDGLLPADPTKLQAALWCDAKDLAQLLKTHQAIWFDPLRLSDHKKAYQPLPPMGFKTAGLKQDATAQLQALQDQGQVLLTAESEAGIARWKTFLSTAKIRFQSVHSLSVLQKLPKQTCGLALTRPQRSLRTPWGVVLYEGDFWPKVLSKRPKKPLKTAVALSELSLFSENDYVTHESHGIGRYEGLQTVEVGACAHDCLALLYEGGDRLFVPIENMHQVWRYGGKDMAVTLDKLGGARWQTRKLKAKEKIRDMALELLNTAAARAIVDVEPLGTNNRDAMQRFEEGFAYLETDDQKKAIEETLADLAKPQPMDRLVCGDVGFGKTEVALRAAFRVASSGAQVAMVVPTTLLARQHTKQFEERFAQSGLRIAHLSRLQKPKEAKAIKEGLKKGTVDIVIATHALLATDVGFCNLGLLIIDEEQHFGVAQKEKLKALKAKVHVLTLTATPIPRTLHMALSDLKSLSLITTPPIDRKAVQTHVVPFSEAILKEVLQKEKARGGQSFVICPRLKHLEKLAAQLPDLLPDARLAVAHGQLPAKALEEVMMRFEEGQTDILLATNIIGSGIDVTSANTLVVFRADLFGLSDLYQLRGRVGRSKAQAYAYLTYPAEHSLYKGALQRLEVMQSLDYLGAGFQVASYDMDIRGAGNLVGAEQSGHMREVGVAYYQKLLSDTMATLKAQQDNADEADLAKAEITTTVTYPGSVLLPKDYVASLELRLGLYRRLSALRTHDALEDFKAELEDRFGPYPEAVHNLLSVMRLKIVAQAACVEKIDIGTKASVITFADNQFLNAQGLLELMQKGAFVCRFRPDQKLVLVRSGALDVHVAELERFLTKLAALL